MALTPEAITLLNKVQRHIEEYPETLSMGDWAEVTDCGTVGCIAYHTISLHSPKLLLEILQDKPSYCISDIAASILQLDDTQASDLFVGHSDSLYKYKGTPQQAAVVSKHIDDFIAQES